MNYRRAIAAGLIGWTLVILTFYILENVTALNPRQQEIVASILIPLYALTGAWFYHRKECEVNGLWLGVTMTVTALVMDVLITVPLYEIPKGGSYAGFFTNLVLWVLVVLNIGTVFIYSKIKNVNG